MGPVPFSADRSLHRDSLQLRGKTARELTIGRRLRELREQQNLTQQEMAGRAGVPRTYISRIENARLLPGPVMLHRIADALAVEILDLLPENRKNGCSNGNNHDEMEQDPFWISFVGHFSRLGSEEMSRVLDRARSMVTEHEAGRVESQLVAS